MAGWRDACITTEIMIERIYELCVERINHWQFKYLAKRRFEFIQISRYFVFNEHAPYPQLSAVHGVLVRGRYGDFVVTTEQLEARIVRKQSKRLDITEEKKGITALIQDKLSKAV